MQERGRAGRGTKELNKSKAALARSPGGTQGRAEFVAGRSIVVPSSREPSERCRPGKLPELHAFAGSDVSVTLDPVGNGTSPWLSAIVALWLRVPSP